MKLQTEPLVSQITEKYFSHDVVYKEIFSGLALYTHTEKIY